MVRLPLMVVFAKITPKRIEATAFAFLTGTINFTGTMRGLVGSAVNSTFVGVSQSDLSNYYILVVINIVMWVTPALYMWLLPTKAQLESKAKEELESVEMASPQITNADDKKRLNLSETSNSVDQY